MFNLKNFFSLRVVQSALVFFIMGGAFFLNSSVSVYQRKEIENIGLSQADVFFLCGVVFFLCGVHFLVKGIKRERLRIYLERNGLTITAKIKNIQVYGAWKEERTKPQEELEYSFKSPVDGSEIIGKTDWLPKGTFKDYKIGQEIKVLYNPDNPEQNYWSIECK